MDTRKSTGISQVAWLDRSFLCRTRWDWIVQVVIPTASVAMVLLGVSAVTRKIDESQVQIQEIARHQKLQNYLTSMTFLIAEHDLSDQNPNDPTVIAANVLTRSVIEELAYEYGDFDEKLVCSADLQHCSNEKSAIINSLVQLNLIESRRWGLNQTSSHTELPGQRVLPPSVSLSGLDLTNINPEHVNMYGADLRNSNLRGSILREGVFYKANLSRANLALADLSGSSLIEANLQLVNMSEANLEDSVRTEISARAINLLS